jgi:hypothetical protein
MGKTKLQRIGNGTSTGIIEKLKVSQPVLKKLSAGEIKKLDEDIEVAPFDIKSLSPAEQIEVNEAASIASAVAVKGFLHAIDPARYPLTADVDSAEHAAAEAAKNISSDSLSRLRPRLEGFLADNEKRVRVLGKLNAIDFKARGLDPEFKRILKKRVGTKRLPEDAHFKVTKLHPKYSRVNLILRYLKCEEETDPKGGTDDMILGGILVGTTGKTKPVAGSYIGEFETGSVHNFGAIPWGPLHMNVSDGYPKSFFAIFTLVESDSDDYEVAHALTTAVSTAAASVVGALASPAAGAVTGTVVKAIGTFIGIFMDEDVFGPLGVELHMESPNTLGGSVGPNMRTKKITGHGGAYRIGYRWELNA